MEDQEIYPAIGQEGFTRLVDAFYRRVPDDPILGPMYPPEDWGGARRRLRGFLIFRFGGPPTYIEERGHPRLRMRHATFPINQAARDRWIQLMTAALEEAELPPEPRQALQAFFESVATFLMNHPESGFSS